MMDGRLLQGDTENQQRHGEASENPLKLLTEKDATHILSSFDLGALLPDDKLPHKYIYIRKVRPVLLDGSVEALKASLPAGADVRLLIRAAEHCAHPPPSPSFRGSPLRRSRTHWTWTAD